jgi:hypothetical protein
VRPDLSLHEQRSEAQDSHDDRQQRQYGKMGGDEERNSLHGAHGFPVDS